MSSYSKFIFSATSTSINHYTNTHCLVDPSGQILWVPPGQYSVLCSFDLRYWPFDTQVCAFKFGSWTHHGEEINITLHNSNTTYIDVIKVYCATSGRRSIENSPSTNNRT